jgi:nucleotide-binding universal stress UspA family protein
MSDLEDPGMLPVPRVVVGVDGSKPSALALQWGIAYAQAIGGTVEAVTAWRIPTEWGFGGLTGDFDPEEDARLVLDETVTRVCGHESPVRVRRLVRRGTAAQVLLNAAKGAVMVVVGSRGHGGFVGMMLGSVSAALAEHSSCPVLVIHGDQTPPPFLR